MEPIGSNGVEMTCANRVDSTFDETRWYIKLVYECSKYG